ncbi:MAG TPA: hypothetical protein VJ954_08160 [Ignavibacteriaceae bacterium]|nr:hypothetical protein [Ignavibacteriaceae bacterium]
MRAKLFTIFAILFATLIIFNANAQDKNAVGAVGPVKFSGLMFGDLFYNAQAINPANRDLNGFQFRRIYVTADYTINDQFTSRFRMESAISSGANIGVFVKDAWLKWKNVFKGSDLIVGMSPTPAFDASEGAWGYRALEKTIMDYFKIVSSRDIGIDLKGRLDDAGVAQYWVKIGDGSGNKPETDKYKRYYARLMFKPSSNLLLTVYGDYASHAPKLDTFDGKMKNNSAFVAAGFINYKHDNAFSIGVEGFIKSQQNNFATTGALETQSGFGVSVWAKAMVSDKVGIVGRYDTYDPNTNSAITNDKQGLIIGAIDFKVAPKVSVMPGVEVHTVQGANDSDITPRVTFFWQF